MKHLTPKVSIVIPAYNHASYLKQAIESVLEQDYENLELIVLDDGSTDGTHELLEKYGGKFKWESHPNMGQSKTLNKGWSMAQGEILSYLSADDLLFPNAVSRSVESLLANPDAVLSYCDFDLIDPDSRVVRTVIAPEYSYTDMVTKFICAPGPGAFFWRTAFEKTGGWDPKIHRFPDIDCWLRLGLHGSFFHINQALAAFRVHDGSQSFSLTPVDRAEEAVRVITKFFELPNLPDELILSKPVALAHAHLLVAQLHLRSFRYLKAILELFEVIRLSPRSLIRLQAFRMLRNGLLNRAMHKLLWRIRQFRNR